MKKKNWFALIALTLMISLTMTSCYYGAYGPPRPRYHHHHGYGGGYHGGGYRY